METTKSRKYMSKLAILPLLVGIALTACGGDPRATDESTTPTTPTTPTDSTLRLGSGSGSAFEEGVIGAGNTSLSAGGTTTLTVTLVDSEGSLSTSAGTVVFSSTCLTAGNSTLGSSGSISLSSGRASTSYTAAGCVGDDIITATATVSGASYTASQTISIAADTSRYIGYKDSGSGSFSEGIIGVGIGSATLSAGGSTSLTVNIVDSEEVLITDSVTVQFNSNCIAAGESILSSSSVVTSTGSATTTYSASGCVGTDTITATASVSGQVLTAQSAINVASDSVQSVAFVDASPTLITLKGTGSTETSSVRFRVLGSTGAPIKDACLRMSLDSTAGGLDLEDVNSTCTWSESTSVGKSVAKTDSSGYATAIVKSGTVATTVTVQATEAVSGISTQSRTLRVSTGVPDQKSMSLSATTKNPSAWDYDGTTVEFTIRLADAFNNSPIDGTVVSFTASGGHIEESCTTADGTCSVTWRSQEPRPLYKTVNFADVLPAYNDVFDPADLFDPITSELNQFITQRTGRVVILAHTNGNESFKDVNGNGKFDAADVFASADTAENFIDANSNDTFDNAERYLDANSNRVYDAGEYFEDADGNGTYSVQENYTDANFNGRYDSNQCIRNTPLASATNATNACDDLGEAYLDANENAQRDNDEVFVDFRRDGDPSTPQFNANNGIYDGILCSTEAEAASLCSKNFVTIRQDYTIVMSSIHPYTTGNGRVIDQPSNINLNITGSIGGLFADINGNALPSGTVITLKVDSATNVKVSPTSYTVASTTEPQDYTWSISPSSLTTASSGSVYFEIAAPIANETTKYTTITNGTSVSYTPPP